jgi:hypothetical protein
LTLTGSEGTLAGLGEVEHMVAVVHGEAGELVIQVEGALDRHATARIARCLGDLPPAAPLVIDFSRVDDLPDVGVAEVAKELAGHSGVAVRGLGRHQLRLLRYCGLQLAPERREADEEARG